MISCCLAHLDIVNEIWAIHPVFLTKDDKLECDLWSLLHINSPIFLMLEYPSSSCDHGLRQHTVEIKHPFSGEWSGRVYQCLKNKKMPNDVLVCQSTNKDTVSLMHFSCIAVVSEARKSRVLSGAVHTGVEVCRMDSEMSGLVERPWLQLMCCAICLPRGCNFRWRRGSPSGSECWMVCRHWTLEIEFNKRLSLLIIRLASYSVTTSLIYKWKV